MLLWTFMYKFLCGHKFLFFLGIYLGVELLGHMVIPYLTFWGNAKLLFSIVATPIYIPTINVQEFPFLHNLTNTFIYPLRYSYPSDYEVASHCGSDLHFPDGSWCSLSFFVLIFHLYIFFRECLFIFLPVFKLGYSSFIIMLLEFFTYSRYNSLVRHITCKDFPLLEGCLFTLFMVSSEAWILFIWMQSNLSIFLFVACVFGVILSNHCPIQGPKDLFLCFPLTIL